MLEKINEIIQKYRINYSRMISKDTEILEFIKNKTKFLDSEICKMSERVYCVINNISETEKCYCGNKRAFININKGYCKTCSYECDGKNKKIFTKDEYIAYVLDKCNLQCLDDYIDMLTPIKHKCLICNYEFLKRPMTAKRRQGCKKCHDIRLTKQHSQYILEIPNEIEVLETYVSAKRKILHRHLECGLEWKSRPNDILTGFSCPDCYRGIYGGSIGKKIKWNDRKFDSILECNCAIELSKIFNFSDIEYQKRYGKENKRTCDFYIKSLDLWIEVSSILEEKYLTKILEKRRQVQNFIFAFSVENMKVMINEFQNRVIT